MVRMKGSTGDKKTNIALKATGNVLKLSHGLPKGIVNTA